MRLLLIGDIVGKPGRQIVVRAVPGLRIAERLDLVIANAESSAGGSPFRPSAACATAAWEASALNHSTGLDIKHLVPQDYRRFRRSCPPITRR